MSELNIATILSNTIAAILDEYTKPMLAHIAEQDERIAALGAKVQNNSNVIIDLANRCNGLESQADEHVARIAVLEQRLNDTENKLTNTRALLLELSNRMAEMTQAQGEQTNLLPIEQRVYTVDQVKAIVAQEVDAAIEAHLENAPHMTEDDMDDKLQDHLNDYDHDQFLTEVEEDAVRDAVRDCLEDVSIRIRLD